MTLLTLALIACSDKDPEDTGDKACTETAWFLDADLDGYGSSERVDACEAPVGYVAGSTDCDDADSSAHPDADEVCDGVDNDCDGSADEEPTDGVTLFADVDLDGYGDANTTAVSCPGEEGWVQDDSDCDDADATAHPGADELCDGADNDCDGSTDGASWPTDFGDDSLALAISETDAELLCVEAGTWDDWIVITDKALTVRGFGVGETILRGAGGEALSLNGADGSVVSDMSLSSVVIYETDGVVLRDIEVGGLELAASSCEGCAIDLRTSDDVLFERVDVRDNELELTGNNPKLLGLIYVRDSGLVWQDGLIEDNEVIASWKTTTVNAVLLYAAASTVELNGVRAEGNSYEISASSSDGNTVQITSRGLFNANSSTMDLVDFDLVDNRVDMTAVNTGGGVAYSTNSFLMEASGGAVTWTGGTVSGNESLLFASSQSQNYLMLMSHDFVLEDVTFTGNSARSETDTGAAIVSGIYLQNTAHTGVRVDLRDNTLEAAGPSGWMYPIYGGYDIDGTTWTNVVLAGNTIEGDNQQAYGVVHASVSQDLVATNLTVVGNRVASDYVVYGTLYMDRSALLLQNSAVHDNQIEAGSNAAGAASVLYLNAQGSATFAYNSFSGNTSNQDRHFQHGNTDINPVGSDGNIDAEPGFTDTSGSVEDWDLSLGAGSDLVDAGDPSVLDPDGSVCDIGAWGGPESF